MKTQIKQKKPYSWARAVLGISLATAFVSASLVPVQAQGAIIFNGDESFQVDQDSLIIGVDNAGSSNTSIILGDDIVGSENGDITWDITDNEFQFSNDIDVNGGIDASGVVEFNDATQFRIREVDFGGNFTGVGSAPACSNDGELAVDTGTAAEGLYICTDNTTDTWSSTGANADLLDGIDSDQFLRSDVSDTFGDGAGAGSAQTFTFGNSGDGDQFVGATGSIFNLGAAGELIIPTGTSNSSGDACIGDTGSLYFNTTDNELLICNGTSYLTTGPQDFEDVYAADADNTLTASSTFDIDATGAVGIDSDAAVTVGGSGVNLQSDGAAGVNISSDVSGGVSITSNGGALSLTGDGTNDIDVNAGTGNLDFDASNFDLLATSDVGIRSSGGDVSFNDQFTTGDITLSETGETAIDAEYGSQSIVGAFNKLSDFTAGDGADIVGVEDGSLAFLGASTSQSVQDALEAIDTALSDNENDVLTFSPEYPNVVVDSNTSSPNNRVRVDMNYDSTELTNFYRMRTRRATSQSVDLVMQFEVPTDFTTAGDLTLRYQTGTANAAQNGVQLSIVNRGATGAGTTSCVTTDVTNTVAGIASATASTTWATITATSIEADCNPAPEDILEVRITTSGTNASGAQVNVGRIEFNYSPN